MTGIVQRITLWLLCSLAPCLQAGVLEIDSAPIPEKLYMAPHISQYIGQVAPNDVRAARTLPDSDFQPLANASPLRPGQPGWFRFAITNTSSSPRSLVLDFDQAVFSHLEWHEQVGNRERYLLTGLDYAFDSRDMDYDFFAFRLNLAPGETATVNFSIRARQAALFIPAVIDQKSFLQEVTFFSRMSGAIMGILYSVCFFLFLYLFVERRSLLVHGMFWFAFLGMLSTLYVNGALLRWVPDSSLPLRDMLYVVLHGLQGVAFAVVVYAFYRFRQRATWLSRVVCLLGMFQFIIIVLVPWAGIDMLVQAVLAVNSLLMLTALGLAILGLFQRERETLLFGAGLLSFLAMTSYSVLGSYGLVPVSFMTRYGYELGLTIQVDFILLAVILQVMAAQKERLAAQAEMFRLNAESAARTRFVDQVTHDLKSPLTAVLGAEELLRDETDAARRKQFLGIIRDSSQQVVAMINDMLGHSALQRGAMVLDLHAVDLPALLDQWQDTFALMPRAEGVAFELQAGPDLPPTIQADPLRLTQLVTNLVTNAFKFTEQGSVLLQVETLRRAAGQVVVRFVVRDTGIGMSASFARRAFEAYAREESRIAGRRGFGLGLSICRQLVEAMGGTIDLVSAPGEGSCFTIDLPFTLPG